MNINRTFPQTIFHMILVLLGLISINGMLYNSYSYITIPYFNFDIPNHNLNLLLVILFFYTVYYNLAHLSFLKKIIFSATIAVFANIFYDMLWNFFYLNSVVNLPQYAMWNLVSLAGISMGLVILLTKLNKDFHLFTITKYRLIQLVASLFVVVFFLTSLYVAGFFQQYFTYIISGGYDPHNLVWATSRIASFLMWVPILRWEHG